MRRWVKVHGRVVDFSLVVAVCRCAGGWMCCQAERVPLEAGCGLYHYASYGKRGASSCDTAHTRFLEITERLPDVPFVCQPLASAGSQPLHMLNLKVGRGMVPQPASVSLEPARLACRRRAAAVRQWISMRLGTSTPDVPPRLWCHWALGCRACLLLNGLLDICQLRLPARPHPLPRLQFDPPRCTEVVSLEDRKSTRLNSSHWE